MKREPAMLQSHSYVTRNWPQVVKLIHVVAILIMVSAACLFGTEWTGRIALALSLSVAYLVQIRPWLNKPRLTLFIDEARCSPPQTATDSASWFIRLGVVNYGLSTAKSCVARLLGVWTESGEPIKKFDPLTLLWSRQDNTHERTGFRGVDIQGFSDFEYLDLAQVKRHDVTPISLRVVINPPMTLVIGDAESASPGNQPSLRAGTYLLRIAVYGSDVGTHIEWYKLKCVEAVPECGQPAPCSIARAAPAFS